MSTPYVRDIAWSYSLKGPCAYCSKTCTRSVTVHAPTEAEASAKAKAAMANLWHRKCGGV